MYLNRHTTGYDVRAVWLALGLAVAAAVGYVGIVQDILPVGGLQMAQDADMILYVAATGYLAGGMLILLRRRWLWLVGLGLNALVVLFFLRLYLARPEVLLSPGAAVTKTAQLFLELALLYLIVADWRSPRPWLR
jgi:hypothetical protein